MTEEQNQLLKKEADELLKKGGMTRGEGYLMALFVKKRYGEEGLKKLEEKLSELLEQSFKFSKGRPKEWYLESRDVLVMLSAKYLFDWQDADLFELGEFHALHSFTMRVLMRYFVSLERIFKDSPKYWQKHFDFSELEAAELNEEKKYFVLRIKGYKFHPVTCKFYAGYFYAISQCAVSSENISIEEIKCVFKGDAFDEFLVKW